MKTRFQLALAGIVAALLFGQTAQAAALNVGDSAPALQTGKWVQGEPVSKFSPDNVYMVEFWATWCGPCRQTIPHLNDLHTKYKDKGLVVIGQNVWERQESLVAPFVKEMGGKMTYRVAMDDKSGGGNGKMAETWMEAAERDGIPSAFLVDKKGKVAWIGHPMELKDSTLEQVLEDKHDLAKAAKDYVDGQRKEKLKNEAFAKFQEAQQGKKWTEAEAALDELESHLGEDEKAGVGGIRVRLHLEKKDFDSAYETAKALTDANADHVMLQNDLAWTLATTRGVEGKLLDLAETMAKRAADKTENKEASILDTLARVQFLKGKKEDAIATQKRAVELADEGPAKKHLQKVLSNYEAGKLPTAGN